MNIIESIEQEARKKLSDKNGSHDWEHTQRVYNMAVHIGKKENANLFVIKLAALLHDIARHEEDKSKGRVCHAKKGAETAQKILKKYNIGEKIINRVLHCIKSHRFRDNVIPKTLEAKVLFDSDKLDSIGAVGIARAYHFAGVVGARLHDKHIDISKTKPYTIDDTGYREYMIKLRHLKSKMFTKEGKRIAEERHKFMESYFNRLNKEVDGKM